MINTPSYVLIVDDEESICWGLERLLTEEGFAVRVASSAEEALVAVKERTPDLAIMDVRLPGMDGLAAMQRLEEMGYSFPVVVITAFGDLETAVTAMNRGAVEYLPKPFDLEQALTVVRRALAGAKAGAVVSDEQRAVPDQLVGKSLPMQDVFKRIAMAAPSDVSVLITGESGTGKELVARAIHRHSRRADRPFFAINLAAFSPTLIESELFGHVRGAFTGADSDRIGLLELADGATVFFDEIGDIPLNLQVKLLRVLETHEITPVGATRPRSTDFRVIAATNRPLEDAIRGDTFRRDLFYRLAGFEISLRPLRERQEDIPVLAEHFLRAARVTPPPSGFTDKAKQELSRRAWYGNVRELRNAIEHAAIMARGLPIAPEHFPAGMELGNRATDDPVSRIRSAISDWATARLQAGEHANLYEQCLTHIEPPLFEAVLHHTHDNRAAAAEILGIHRATLRKKMG